MKSAYSVVRKMLLTEKGTRLAEIGNKYLFKVDLNANKQEIKKAIEELFGVKVESVNTMRRLGKKKRERSMSFGKTADWKRAVVTLADGETIDLT